jgi:hypothetical protein
MGGCALTIAEGTGSRNGYFSRIFVRVVHRTDVPYSHYSPSLQEEKYACPSAKIDALALVYHTLRVVLDLLRMPIRLK